MSNHNKLLTCIQVSIRLIDKHSVVTMDDMCLNKTESLKYLGMIKEPKLNWNSHIAHVKIKYLKVFASCLEQGIMSQKVV